MFEKMLKDFLEFFKAVWCSWTARTVLMCVVCGADVRFVPHSTTNRLQYEQLNLFHRDCEVFLYAAVAARSVARECTHRRPRALARRLDYCGPEGFLPAVSAQVKKLTLIDHHKTAQELVDAMRSSQTLPENGTRVHASPARCCDGCFTAECAHRSFCSGDPLGHESIRCHVGLRFLLAAQSAAGRRRHAQVRPDRAPDLPITAR
jgi:hypothetical protein